MKKHKKIRGETEKRIGEKKRSRGEDKRGEEKEEKQSRKRTRRKLVPFPSSLTSFLFCFVLHLLPFQSILKRKKQKKILFLFCGCVRCTYSFFFSFLGHWVCFRTSDRHCDFVCAFQLGHLAETQIRNRYRSGNTPSNDDVIMTNDDVISCFLICLDSLLFFADDVIMSHNLTQSPFYVFSTLQWGGFRVCSR